MSPHLLVAGRLLTAQPAASVKDGLGERYPEHTPLRAPPKVDTLSRRRFQARNMTVDGAKERPKGKNSFTTSGNNTQI